MPLPSASSPMSRATLLRLTLLVVILLGSGARALDLAGLPVWHDETFSLLRIFGHPFEALQAALEAAEPISAAELLRFQRPDPALGWTATLRALASHPEHAPLYYLLGRVAGGLASDPVVGLRGLAALFGVLLVPAVFWLTRELGGRGLTPWVAAALVAVSPVQLLYAQEARQYALWLLLVVAASAALLHACRHDRRGDWWGYGALLTLGLYTHLLFVLMLPVHALVVLARRERWRRWFIAVVTAGVLFLPWVAVMAFAPERIDEFTAWMQRPIDGARILAAWRDHLMHTFVDLGPTRLPGWAVGLLLMTLVWALWRFVVTAPGAAVRLLLATILVHLGIVLGPDLVLGGSRSLHLRYALPALLALSLILAWSLGRALEAAGPTAHVAALALLLLLALGLGSQHAILEAETWRTKQFSADNAAIAERINRQATGVEVLASPSGVSAGELLSLAHQLAPETRLRQLADPAAITPAPERTYYLLTPSESLRAQLAPTHRITPIAPTWQWFVATPEAGPTPDSGASR
ncbi:glycosyltransferase family 39 protein [Marichromatium sp. AB31]|uniref:glycosyltransferase family 39 protein n=1 Tax=Marichromatium sp. AB31 TaxID=2483362 RepID=UPI0011CEA202|nr:glycosyltransferase family 39 protein [Marichromatium sp. AB31]